MPPPPPSPPARRGEAAIAAAVAVLVALRVVHWLLAPPNTDEAYYWTWGQHPALSYYDHPALLAWADGLLHAALGRSRFVLRLPAALSAAGTIVVLARMAGRLGAPRRRRALLVAAALLGSPLFLMMTSFAWPDAILIFLSALSGSLLVDFLGEVAAGGRGSTARLLLGGAALGAAGLAKYNAVFVGVGVAVAIVTDRRLRPLLRDLRVWAAAAAALLVASPILLWNLDHGFASFRLHLAQPFAGGVHLRPLGPLAFLAPALPFLSPALVAAAALALRRAAPAADAWGAVYRRTALAVLASSTAVFLALSLVARSVYYWNVVGYVLLLPAAAVALAAAPRLLAAHLGYGVVAAALLVVHATVIPLSVFFPWVRDDDSKEPLGWTRIAAAVREELARGPDRFPAATGYRAAAHLAWALGSADVVAISPDRSQFDYWVDPARAGGTAILVTDARAPMSPEIARRFARVRRLAVLGVDRLGVRIKSYELWAAEGFRLPAARAP